VTHCPSCHLVSDVLLAFYTSVCVLRASTFTSKFMTLVAWSMSNAAAILPSNLSRLSSAVSGLKKSEEYIGAFVPLASMPPRPFDMPGNGPAGGGAGAPTFHTAPALKALLPPLAPRPPPDGADAMRNCSPRVVSGKADTLLAVNGLGPSLFLRSNLSRGERDSGDLLSRKASTLDCGGDRFGMKRSGVAGGVGKFVVASLFLNCDDGDKCRMQSCEMETLGLSHS